MQTYRHKKTGKPYSVVTDNFMFKQDGKWIKNLVLYEALYDNPDGKYFARTKEDFEENFEAKSMQIEQNAILQELKALHLRMEHQTVCNDAGGNKMWGRAWRLVNEAINVIKEDKEKFKW